MWRDEASFLDMLLAARHSREFLAGMTWEEFEQSHLHQNAVARTLEIIGEAASKVSKEVKKAHPEIPWSDITGMRNLLIHEYFRVNLDKVWDTVQNDIPPLISALEKIVPPEEKS